MSNDNHFPIGGFVWRDFYLVSGFADAPCNNMDNYSLTTILLVERLIVMAPICVCLLKCNKKLENEKDNSSHYYVNAQGIKPEVGLIFAKAASEGKTVRFLKKVKLQTDFN